jgi:uncharacterized protein (TIGR03435 family)
LIILKKGCPVSAGTGIYRWMQTMDDMTLLREYAQQNSEAAFAELVSRHVGFVYSAALRQVRDPQRAEEITQTVFIILAQKAGQISGKTILTGWLFKTTRFTVIAQVRAAAKRQQREQEAQMQSPLQPAAPDGFWEQLSPLLDEALASLGETDRQAVLLRFFENQSLAEVGSRLGTGEDTARKRVARALEKLHRYFDQHGVNSTTAIIAGAISANSVQAAPAALIKSVTAVAIAKGAAASGSTLTLIKGALKIMAWAKAKMAMVVGASVLLAVGTTVVVVENTVLTTVQATAPTWADDPQYWSSDPRVLGKNPRVFIFRPTRFPSEDAVMIAWGKTALGPTRYMAKNTTLSVILPRMYNVWQSRVIWPSDFPTERFDLMFTLSNQPQKSRAILLKEFRRRFGLIAHRETREVDALALKVTQPPGSGLQSSSGNRFSRNISKNEIRMSHAYLLTFCGEIESRLGAPIVDKTDLDSGGRYYDIHIQWQPQPNETEDSAFKRALRDQLGLELVPSRESLEMLVVEKAK